VSVVGDRLAGLRLQTRGQVRRRAQHGIEERSGAGEGPQLAVRGRLGDLPVATRIDAQGPLVGERRREDLIAFDGRAGDQVVDQFTECLVDPPDRGLLE
jgi:hypothetical protein